MHPIVIESSKRGAQPSRLALASYMQQVGNHTSDPSGTKAESAIIETDKIVRTLFQHQIETVIAFPHVLTPQPQSDRVVGCRPQKEPTRAL